MTDAGPAKQLGGSLWRRAVSSRVEIQTAARSALSHFLHSQLPVMAAALSFRTIFGIVPVIVMGLVVIGGFAPDEQIADTVRTMLRYTGLSDIALEEAPPVGPPAPPELGGAAPSWGPPGSGEGAQRLDQWIGGLVTNVRRIPLKTIGFVGLLALIYAALSMLVETERAFNHVYRAPAGRSWGARVARYWTMLTLGTIFVVLTFVITERVTRWVSDVALYGSSPIATILRGLLGYFITVLISTFFLVTIYILVPNATVKLRPALAGAFVAAMLWEAGKWGFTQYLRSSASSSYGRLYGSIALIPLFMLWVYLTWLIVLLGLYISYALQTFKEHPLTKAVDRPPPIVDPASILIVVGAVAERFNLGKRSDPSDIAQATGVDPEVVTAMLERLTQAGVLLRVSDSAERIGFTLGRPPGTIAASEILAIGNDLAGTPDKQRAPTSLAQVVSLVRNARASVTDGKSMADLVSGSKPEASEPSKPG